MRKMKCVKSIFIPLVICCICLLLWQTWVISRGTSRYMAVVSYVVSQDSAPDKADGSSKRPTGIMQERSKQNKDHRKDLPAAKTINGNDMVIRKIKYEKTQHDYQGTKNLSELFLVILVTSHLAHIDRRLLIRATWGKDSAFKSRWKTIFVVGKSNQTNKIKTEEVYKLENAVHGDLLKLDFVEDFYNLSHKVWKSFNWVLNNVMFSYLLKVDDDVFVNVPQLLIFLKSASTPTFKLYVGNCHAKARVRRKGRYAVSKKDYSNKYYPSYCSGGGFILSKDVVHDVVEHYNQQEALVIDDVYVGLLIQRTGVNITHYKKGFRMNEKRCKFRRYTLVLHPLTGDCLKSLYVKSVNSFLRRKLNIQTNLN